MIAPGRLAAALLTVVLAACAALPAPDAPHALRAGAPADGDERVIVIAVANPLAELPRLAGSTPGLYARRPRYVAGGDAQALLAAVAREHGLQPLAAWPIPALGVHCATYLIPPGVDRDVLLARLRNDPRVEIAQPLNRFDTLAAPSSSTYDDPYLPLQSGLQQLGVLQAHRCSRGQGARIAVVDTGVDMAHPDLQGAATRSANFVDADDARFQRDLHGTEVAGVIAARPGNARGIVGIAPDAQLIALKACWQREDGTAACNSFSLAQALAGAIDRSAQVINLSLGGPRDELLTRLVQAAQARGAVVVGAMPPGGARDGFPVGIPGVIAVGDGRGGELAAPMREVLTLTPGGRYDFASGSSIAAAQVSGLAALLLERRPGLDGPTLERTLRSSGPNACRALAALDAGCHCTTD